jgi:hypothetical protein
VLEEYLSPSPLQHHGQRVVEGQRLTQTVSDIFLGWTRNSLTGHLYYWRQLRDWKGSFNIETASPQVLMNYTRPCGWTLARAHARTGDPVGISGYLGKGEVFDRALTRFAERYSERNRHDYDAFTTAIRSGRLDADFDH